MKPFICKLFGHSWRRIFGQFRCECRRCGQTKQLPRIADREGRLAYLEYEGKRYYPQRNEPPAQVSLPKDGWGWYSPRQKRISECGQRVRPHSTDNEPNRKTQ
jgi:hypothetical protein